MEFSKTKSRLLGFINYMRLKELLNRNSSVKALKICLNYATFLCPSLHNVINYVNQLPDATSYMINDKNHSLVKTQLVFFIIN